jgi:hypothetical protein
MKFQEFKKIPRLNRPSVLTEKLDGTTACIIIGDPGEYKEADICGFRTAMGIDPEHRLYDIFVQSRNRFITPENDNYGFAKWVRDNSSELTRLGHGYHYGEWWGNGINRNYGLSEKRFSLFNVHRWADPEVRPNCCDVVPILATWENGNLEDAADYALQILKQEGSRAAPGFMNPEGVIIFHTASNNMFKKTFDDTHKGVKTPDKNKKGESTSISGMVKSTPSSV